MADEQIKELEKQVDDAYQLLVKLNGEYNELLTKEHEKNIKKNATPTSWAELKRELRRELDEVNKEQTVDDKENYEKGKVDLLHSTVWFFALFLGLAHVIPISIAMLVLFLNFGLKVYRTEKIRRKYHPEEYQNKKKDNKNNEEDNKELEFSMTVDKKGDAHFHTVEVPKNKVADVRIKLSPKEEKDDLYERVSEARFNYHRLRKELESKKFNREIETKQEEVLEEQVDLFSQYQAYIDYISDNLMAQGILPKNNIKMYELKSDDYK